MPWLDRNETYGWLSIGLHWLVAACVFGLFFLGHYMVDLTYYDRWYNKAPAIHKAIGMIVFSLLVVRVGWHRVCHPPAPLPTWKPWERTSAKVVHKLLYLFAFLTVVSGYLIPTAEGHGISIFGLFEVPALLPTMIERQADVAGRFHVIFAHLLFFVAVAHGLAALKHHIFDKDRTLLRMLISK